LDKEGGNIVETKTSVVTKKEIQDVLLDMGVPENLIGSMYLTHALELVLDNPRSMTKLVDGLYVDIGKRFNVKSTSVERCMRHAINATWKRGNVPYINTMFRYCLSPQKDVPTNSQFITRLYYYFTNE